MRDSDYAPREDAGERFEDDPTRPVLCTYRSEPRPDATPHVGIALPEDVQARAIYSAERAIKLGLELVKLGRTLQAAQDSALEEYAERADRRRRLDDWQPEEIRSAADAEAFLRAAVEWLGLSFHVDTPFGDYLDSDGDPEFDRGQAERLDDCLVAVADEVDDPAAVALRIMQPMIAASGGTP